VIEMNNPFGCVLALAIVVGVILFGMGLAGAFER